MSSQYVKLPLVSGGGGGAVNSVFGRTGTVVAQANDYGASLIANTPAGNIVATDVQAAIDELDTEKQATITGNNNSVIYKNSTGDVICLDSLQVDNTSKGLIENIDFSINNIGGGYVINNNTLDMVPTANSPLDAVTWENTQVNIDPGSTGFSIGTNGTAILVWANNVTHAGTSDIGSVNLTSQNFNIGNGTDAISTVGVGYSFGFGSVNSGVTINDWIQGYGFQPNIQSGATMNGYTNAFYDASNYAVPAGPYTSVQASPTLNGINNNANYSGLNCAPQIGTFAGNAGFTGVGIFPNITSLTDGGFQGVAVSPTIGNVKSAVGVNVTMDNVTTFVGSPSTVTIADLTFTFNENNAYNNNYQIEYTAGATAGSEVVSIAGFLVTVQIEDGVSTASQIKTACEANFSLAAALTITVTGVGSNPQNIIGPQNFAGGVDNGTKKAASFDGDVEITGALSFGGALSVGKFSAYYSQPLVNGTGNPASVHSLITAPTVAANATITNGDLLGINTAALINLGANSTTTTGFLGVASLGLPAVLTMGAGATVDRVGGAVFALSLDAAAGGGTADIVELCRSLAIPNGSTTVNKLYGYKFDLPFGSVGTTMWGYYSSVNGAHNYFAGDLLLGGTAGSDDTVTNSSVALEIKSTTKAAVISRMDSTAEAALTAINGMIIYNTDTDKFRGYAGGAWVDLN